MVNAAIRELVDDNLGRGEERRIDLVEVILCFLEDVVERLTVALGLAAGDLLEIILDLRRIHRELDLAVVDGRIVGNSHRTFSPPDRRNRCRSDSCRNLSRVKPELV